MSTPKPLRADARRNRARVLEVAEQTFAKRGLAVSIDEIAQQAGVGVGTIYRHFPTKEALFGAIVVDRIQRLVDEARALADAGDPGEAFFRYFTHVIEEAVLNKALYEALSEEAGVETAIGELGERLVAAQGVLLARAQRAGAIRKDVDAGDLKALVTGCVAMESQGIVSGRMTTIVCDGLRPPGRGRASRGAVPRRG
jgi:AcrR family transcriptional regulator